jgi:two-component system response regulator WspF
MRIGIVDDLQLAREALKLVVQSVPRYVVAWVAHDGAEAVRRAREDRPDVVLMDLVMPVMDGVEATRRIMAESPCPVLLVTSSVSGNHRLVFAAMSCGGIDAVDTPVLGTDGKVRDGERLLEKLARLEKASKPSLFVHRPASLPPVPTGPLPPLVAIGTSTGGPEALAAVLEQLPVAFPAPVVVVQHISAEFVPNLVVWLQGRCRLAVEAARPGGRPRPGVVSVAMTDDHLMLGHHQEFTHVREPADYPFRPSVNVFFHSLGSAWPRPGVAVILTGMGDDGALGLAALRQAGWLTIAQDRESSVVYGMPKAAAEMNAASRILGLGQIGGAVLARLAASGG